METIYIPGDSPDFVAYINSHGDNARVEPVDGHWRWVIKREDGTEYIARPEKHE